MEKMRLGTRWFKTILKILFSLLLVFILACFIFDHYYQFRKSDQDLKQFYTANHIKANINYFQTQGRKLRYVSVGDINEKGTLVFLHGSPGSMSFYSRRFADQEILDKFHIYAMDRPGYGYSGFGDPEPSVQKQSEMVRVLIDSLHQARHPIIVVGSSFGAAIACRLAMDHPDIVDGLVLTGPAIGPGLEKYFWFTHVIEAPVIRWFIPRMFRSANTEKVYHRKELEKMLPYWKNIRVPVAYLQGENDEIVDTANATFARTHLVNAPYLDIQFVKQRGHRLAQYEWPRFKEAIWKVYKRGNL